MTVDLDEEAVRAANARFYQALETADLDLMDEVWLHSEEAVCAHPGRTPLRGWESVRQSWEAILRSGGNPQVIITEEEVTLRGSLAWVTVTENMISGGQTGAAAALNIFERDGGVWRMILHQAGPVMA